MFDIVVFPFHDWKKCQSQGLVRRDTQIILGLEQIPAVRNILLVDRPVSLPIMAYDWIHGQRSSARGGELVWQKRTAWLRKLSPKLHVLDTLVLEPFSSVLLRKRWWPHIQQGRSFLSTVRDAAAAIHIRHPILWMFTPISTPAIGCMNERLVVFDALDNWVEHAGMSAYREAARRGYAQVRAQADLAFCCSESMRDLLSGGKPRAFWLPNGVDLAAFQPIPNCLPSDTSSIGAPRVGYAGVVDSRVDLALLAYCAKALPQMNFIIVGPVSADKASLSPLLSLHNVHLIGRKRYHEMPMYINSFDLCLIPHKVNRYTDGMNPLKLYEYLACGKPVVSTTVAGVSAHSNVIEIADNPKDFANAIVSSLESDSAARSAVRRESVYAHSWSARLQYLWARVEETMEPLGNRIVP